MAEWLYEEGIGENRAILVEGAEILEAAIELPGLRAGAIVPARLTSAAGIATLANGVTVIVALPHGLTEGSDFHAEIVRESVPEQGHSKSAWVRVTERPLGDGPSLADRIGNPRPVAPVSRDRFEEAGWSEVLEEAATGRIPFEGGSLQMDVTAAMTLFDVNGRGDSAELAVAGATAAAKAIRRFGISGSIGIDLPTLPRARRQEAAAAVDAILPQPFERSAVNGFGFLQIVRRRVRPSLPEIVGDDPVGAAARALLRRAERLSGPVILHAAPRVATALETHPDWISGLARRTGGPVTLRAEAGLAISAGHAENRQA